jgi:hypothetical protein
MKRMLIMPPDHFVDRDTVHGIDVHNQGFHSPLLPQARGWHCVDTLSILGLCCNRIRWSLLLHLVLRSVWHLPASEYVLEAGRLGLVRNKRRNIPLFA